MNKRILTNILTISAVIALAVCASSCTNRSVETSEITEETEQTETTVTTTETTPAETTLESLETETTETTLSIDYSIDPALLGHWQFEDEGYIYSYDFADDNTGCFNIVNTDSEAQNISQDFIYVADGTSFTVYIDNEEADVAQYTIEGDVLTVDTGADDPVALTR